MKKFLKENKGIIIFYTELVIITLIVLNNLQKGIDFFISNLKNNYIDIGLDTIELIQPKYCHIGINDNGNNKYWVSGVTKYYKELGGK